MNKKGFSLIEVLVATAIFLLFALGIYGGIHLIFKIVYNSRLQILETAILSEKLEVVRNLPFDQVGILNGIPVGVLPYSQTITRNGVPFDIITTVRNIDDPFDGMVTGTPQIDTSPADYKLVEMSIICQNCLQSNPVILSARVSPKGLEGSSNNGSLFIHVFDSQGIDVPGATVNVEYYGSSAINLTDTTDNNGMVRIIDTPTGTEAYVINITKSGYSSDYTVSSTAGNPNPTKPPSTVISQTVTEISFSIDIAGSLNLTTLNASCVPIPNAGFYVRGDKKIGNNPTVYKFDQTLASNGSGLYNFANVEWDNYYFNSTSTSYNLAGSVPILPINMTAGLTQAASLIFEPYSQYSMLVSVRDSGTQQPLTDVSVRLKKGAYDNTVTTSIGYVRQTDWSGGSGQVLYTDLTKYFADNANIEINSPAGDLELVKVGNTYQNPGWLESSIFDMGPSVTYRNVFWDPISQPNGTSVRLQLATSNTSTPASWYFAGPDGTNSTYYTVTTSLIYANHTNDRYMKYKVYLDTADTSKTPQVFDLIFTYTNQCTPPGQAYFGSLSSGTYTLEVSKDGYEDFTDSTIEINSSTQAIIDMSLSE